MRGQTQAIATEQIDDIRGIVHNLKQRNLWRYVAIYEISIFETNMTHLA